ncbi:synaptonemal complex central element protein 2 [Nothoprocta perdicaria]|uniref:synaptonemal complex central element protein 2 n=1 Tax=Nothoprocta perdicaria TaxID=30464 RepID=UPI000E1C2F15|nr:synaptonemal complex central element protein 2 [Nothoprocta perdicaria]
MAAFEEPLWPRGAPPPVNRGAAGATGEKQPPPVKQKRRSNAWARCSDTGAPHTQPGLHLAPQAAAADEEGADEELQAEAAPLDGPFFAAGGGDLPASPGAAPGTSAFAALAGSVGGLRQRAQHLVDKVNESRKADHAVMSGFRESLLLKVSALAEQLEERLFSLYDAHNGLIQERLRELAAATERIAQLQSELRRACRALEAAYRDLCLQPEP